MIRAVTEADAESNLRIALCRARRDTFEQNRNRPKRGLAQLHPRAYGVR